MLKWPLVILVIFGACKQVMEQSTDDQSQSTNGIQHATRFNITGDSVIVTEPWPGAVNEVVYTLDPPETIVVTSTTVLPHLEMLGLTESVIGFPNTRYIYSSAISSLVENGHIRDLGPDGNLNIELLLDAAPEAVIAFDMGNESTTLDKIDEAGIPVIYSADYLEPTALGRAEWIKFYGELFDRRSMSDSIFNLIRANYDSLRQLAQQASHRPTVFSGVLYGDTWFLPGGNNWSAAFFEDAGAQYLWQQNQSSGWLELSFESVFDKANDADYWIGTSTFNSLSELEGQDQRYAAFDVFAKGKVFSYCKRLSPGGGYDFFESGYARPDLVLADLIKIIHPELLPDYETFYYEQLR